MIPHGAIIDLDRPRPPLDRGRIFDEPLRLGSSAGAGPRRAWRRERLAERSSARLEIHHFGELRAVAAAHPRQPYDNELLPELLDRAGIQVVLLPGPYTETFGHVMTEALVAGVPVVGAGYGALGDASGPAAGWTIDPKDRYSLREALVRRSRSVPPRDPAGGGRGAGARAASGGGDGRQVRQHLPAPGIVRTLGGGGNMSEERLRRQLRAQAVVNRQLHAQLAEVTAQLRAVQGHDASAVRVLWRRLEAVLPNRVTLKVERRLRGALGTPPRPRLRGWVERGSGGRVARRPRCRAVRGVGLVGPGRRGPVRAG